MKKLIAILCIISILFSGTALLAEDFNYGEEWLQLSKGARLMWVWGYTAGQTRILSELKIKPTKNLKFLILLEDASIISKIMCQYYNDAANTYIPWCYMTYIAKMKLNGRSAQEIGKEFEDLRRYAEIARSINKKIIVEQSHKLVTRKLGMVK